MVMVMPVVYRCRNCGYILYVHWRVGQNSYGVPTPSEVASWYGGLCPRCGRKLNVKPDNDDVYVVAGRELVAERTRILERLLIGQREGIVITARMPVSLAEILDNVARRLGVSRSEALRLAVARLAREVTVNG